MIPRRAGGVAVAGSEIFPRQLRLREEKNFRDLISNGAKISTPYFFLRHRSNGGQDPRLGIVVPKKTFRRVVDRNRLKRLARESFRRVAAGLPDHDFLVYYLAPALPAEGALLAKSLRDCWARISK